MELAQQRLEEGTLEYYSPGLQFPRLSQGLKIAKQPESLSRTLLSVAVITSSWGKSRNASSSELSALSRSCFSRLAIFFFYRPCISLT